MDSAPSLDETAEPPRRKPHGYRGVLRAIADSVEGDCDAALDYVLVKHGTQDGSSYAPTELSDASELDDMAPPQTAHLRPPKGLSHAEAAATLEAIGAVQSLAGRRAQLLADGYSASLTRGPYYLTMTVSRDGQLFSTARAERETISLRSQPGRLSCFGSCDCDGSQGFCSVSLTLVVRASGCVAAVTTLGAWGAFHVEEILVPEIFMASAARHDGVGLATVPPQFYPRLIDARAKARYGEQITRVFARFLVLALTGFDGRLVSYVHERSTERTAAPAPRRAARVAHVGGMAPPAAVPAQSATWR